MYKLVLLDVDGTLVESNEHAMPSKRVVAAIQAASKKADVAIVTGRPYAFTKNVITALGVKGFGVFNGGAEIINLETGEQIFRQTMSIETAREAATIALVYGYKIFHTIGDNEVELSSPEDISEPSDKLLIENVLPDEALNIIAALEAVEGTITHPVSAWQKGVVTITIAHELASKRHGAERLIQMLGHSKDETIGIGDGHNDIPLFEAVGLGVAMGDAPDEVKQLADYVTTSLSEDGVAVALEKFVLK